MALGLVWPVLLAWCGTWWALLALGAFRARGALSTLDRLLRRQVRDRLGYDVRPERGLGVGWTLVLVLAGAMLALAVALLVLQARRRDHYRLVART